MGWDGLVALGPIHTTVWKVRTQSFEEPLVAEAWKLEGSDVLEISLKTSAQEADRLTGELGAYLDRLGFEAQPILRWIAALHERGIDCPVHVGVAGPASVATLAKFAIRCGIGVSLRALARGHTAFARILVEAGPDGLIGELVAGEDARAPVAGLHVFTFGGVRRAAEWIRGYLGRPLAVGEPGPI